MKTNWTADSSYFDLHASQDLVLARTWDSLNGGRVFLSADRGESWEQSSAADSDIDILSLVLLGDNSLLAGTWGNSYRAAGGGKGWDVLTRWGIPADTAIRSMAVIASVLYAGTTGNVYKSSDSGETWVEVRPGIPADATVFSIAGSGDAIFAGTDRSGVLVTRNDDTGWAEANSGLNDRRISQLAVVGSRLFAVTLGGVFVSDDKGQSWTPDSSGIKRINVALVIEDQLLAGTDAHGAYFSSDGGASWNPLGAGLPDGARIWSLAANRDTLFAGTDSGIWRASCE